MNDHPPHRPLFLSIGQEPPLRILFEDASLFVLYKPAGQLFHGYTKGAPSPLVDQLKHYIRKQKGKSGEVYLGVVHRLDRPVSGATVLARNSKTSGRLGEQFQSRSIRKIYLALVEGVPEHEQDTLQDMLVPPPSADRPKQNLEAKLCSLTYRKLFSANGLSLLEIELETGRRHQIRMQMSQRGWPLVGDREYGAQTCLPGTEALEPRFCPIALHASRLCLRHPSDGTVLDITAPIPAYWTELLAAKPHDLELTIDPI